MSFVITKEMRGDEKLNVCDKWVEAHFIPVLENYHGRELTPREKRIVSGHISMLFMEPCPLHMLSASDILFAENMGLLSTRFK